MGEHIIIMGGGVIGLSCAFEALRCGYQVSVIEAGQCGGQASGAAAGMLAPYSENGVFPDDFFRLCVESLRLYPEWQQSIKEVSGEEFEYTNSGSLYVMYHEADLTALRQRSNWQNEHGAQSEIVMQHELRQLEPQLSEDVYAALYTPVESHVHAPDYVKALLKACRKLGAQVYEQFGEAKPELTDSGVRLTNQEGRQVAGDRLVISSGAWSGLLERDLGIRIPVFPIRGQICSYDITPGHVRHMVFSSQGYMVAKRDGQLVCGASEDLAGFDSSVTEQGIARLEAWNYQMFPFVRELPPTFKWAGLRPATQDGYPLIGMLSTDERIIMACGHYRNGILLSPITANIVAQLLAGKENRTALQAFSPQRFGSVRSIEKEESYQ